MVQANSLDWSKLSQGGQEILSQALNLSRAELSLNSQQGHINLTEEKMKEFKINLARLESGEPLAYILGNWPFMGLELKIQPKLLVPRPETEWWVMEYLLPRVLETKPQILADIGCGPGTIGLGISHKLAAAGIHLKRLIMVDADPVAIKMTQINWDNLGLKQTQMNLILESANDFISWLPTDHEHRPSIIISNPPYLDAAENDSALNGGENHLALFAPNKGLFPYFSLIQGLNQAKWSGELWLEIDPRRVIELKTFISEQSRIVKSDFLPDQFGRLRVLNLILE